MARVIDYSEVVTLAVDLHGADSRMNRARKKAVSTAAFRIKRHMRDDFESSGYYPHIKWAINYDLFSMGPAGSGAEIGVDKEGPQGGLGNILAYGTSNSATVVDHTAGLRREAPFFVRALADAMEESVLG